jgi:hypothetical protein
MNPLKQFYDMPTIREAVKDFQIKCLKDLAVDKTFEGEDVKGIKEARELVDHMFDTLEELYGKIDTVTKIDSR